MVSRMVVIAAAALAFGSGAPVLANPILPLASAAVPEPSDFALFLIGVAGLLIGRRGSRRRHQDDDDTKA